VYYTIEGNEKQDWLRPVSRLLWGVYETIIKLLNLSKVVKIVEIFKTIKKC
jgi:hypothetical protein